MCLLQRVRLVVNHGFAYIVRHYAMVLQQRCVSAASHYAGQLLARSRLHASVLASCAAELHCCVVLRSVVNH